MRVFAAACIKAGLSRRWAQVAGKAAFRAYDKKKEELKQSLTAVLDGLIRSLPDLTAGEE
jgi:hypothetical protein